MYLPNKVTPFICRNHDMFDVLRLISQNKIVQIFGLPGFGKSSLLKNVTCFLGERDIY
jgi:ABC-type cobalamin/Fe3+-siderophores transport system ATPase subunit